MPQEPGQGPATLTSSALGSVPQCAGDFVLKSPQRPRTILPEKAADSNAVGPRAFLLSGPPSPAHREGHWSQVGVTWALVLALALAAGGLEQSCLLSPALKWG